MGGKCREVFQWRPAGRYHRRSVFPRLPEGASARLGDHRAFRLKGTGHNLVVGTESWGVAIALGSIAFVFGLGLAVWAVRDLGGRNRIYVVTRASLYLILGIGLVAGHWMRSIGVASVAFFFAGAITVAFARRRILGAGSASA